jgi:hypothetical protein
MTSKKQKACDKGRIFNDWSNISELKEHNIKHNFKRQHEGKGEI